MSRHPKTETFPFASIENLFVMVMVVMVVKKGSEESTPETNESECHRTVYNVKYWHR